MAKTQHQQITHSSDSWFSLSFEAGMGGKMPGEKDWTSGPDWRKTTRKAGAERETEAGEWQDIPNSRSTWAVGAWLAASPGCWRPAHVTLFMNGAVWRRKHASQRAEEEEEEGLEGGGGAFCTDSERRSKERRGGGRREIERARGGGPISKQNQPGTAG